MKIFSDHRRDARSEKKSAGAYEWWYFDGADEGGIYSFTVIFYEGNPFSTRYIRQQEKNSRSEEVRADDFPAVSISIYRKRKPIYYSFTEVRSRQATFGADHPYIKIQEHTMKMEVDDRRLMYRLDLSEELPSGDGLEGSILFESVADGQLEIGGTEGKGHRWNLVQPRANVTVDLTRSSHGGRSERISFTGLGYHDHNTGQEPMKNEFQEWSWGRFHFDAGTLVYYVMDRKTEIQHEAWLIGPDNGSVLTRFPEITLEDRGWTRFGMRPPRRIILDSQQGRVTVQHSSVMDNGPFYQRFGSDAFLISRESETVQARKGVAEYIRPDRIHWRLFWPLTDMRIRYSMESPHWVQRSPRLYRLTW